MYIVQFENIQFIELYNIHPSQTVRPLSVLQRRFFFFTFSFFQYFIKVEIKCNIMHSYLVLRLHFHLIYRSLNSSLGCSPPAFTNSQSQISRCQFLPKSSFIEINSLNSLTYQLFRLERHIQPCLACPCRIFWQNHIEFDGPRIIYFATKNMGSLCSIGNCYEAFQSCQGTRWMRQHYQLKRHTPHLGAKVFMKLHYLVKFFVFVCLFVCTQDHILCGKKYGVPVLNRELLRGFSILSGNQMDETTLLAKASHATFGGQSLNEVTLVKFIVCLFVSLFVCLDLGSYILRPKIWGPCAQKGTVTRLFNLVRELDG